MKTTYLILLGILLLSGCNCLQPVEEDHNLLQDVWQMAQESEDEPGC